MKKTGEASERSYEIYNREGRLVMIAPESFRYPPYVELSLIEAGHTIKINGKRITKKEIKNDNP